MHVLTLYVLLFDFTTFYVLILFCVVLYMLYCYAFYIVP